MWIKVNEVNEREKIINLAHVEQISSNGVTGSIFWFGKDDVDSMYVKESYEEVQQMVEYATGKAMPDALTAEMVGKVIPKRMEFSR